MFHLWRAFLLTTLVNFCESILFYQFKPHMQCCPKGIKTTLIRFSKVPILIEHIWEKVLFRASRTALHKVFPLQCFPDDILLGQHCTDTIPVQCWPWGSREQYLRKNLVHCCLHALRATLHRSKPYVMLL